MKLRTAKPKIAPPTRGGPRVIRRQRQKDDAENFFAPFEVIENPDWLVGAD